jgi:hypothetical protein
MIKEGGKQEKMETIARTKRRHDKKREDKKKT